MDLETITDAVRYAASLCTVMYDLCHRVDGVLSVTGCGTYDDSRESSGQHKPTTSGNTDEGGGKTSCLSVTKA